MMADKYHLVPGKVGLERASFEMQLNEHPATIFNKSYHVDRHAPRLHKYAQRPSIIKEDSIN